ncbi:hypothetical protein TNCV_5003401 [Trichonephila clavipes]|nr:hypothetical protein TNCV_5003401 [Trichonephila clavipes]
MVSYAPGDLVWVLLSEKKVGLSEKLLKVFRTVSGATPFISRDLRSTDFDLLHEKKTGIHVLRMKPYHDPAEQIRKPRIFLPKNHTKDPSLVPE